MRPLLSEKAREVFLYGCSGKWYKGGDPMKYMSVDRLSDFEFHDAEIELVSFAEHQLIVQAQYLNVHQDAAQNPFETDMQIDRARMVFEGFDCISYEPGRAWHTDEKGKLYTDEPQKILLGDDARRRFLEQLNVGLTLYDFYIQEEKTYVLDAMAIEPFFTVCVTFDRVVIEWDEYQAQAWYVPKKG